MAEELPQYPEFSRRLMEALTEHAQQLSEKITQQWVADLFGVSQPTARDWILGNMLPAMANMVQIADKTGVCIEWLVMGRGDKYPSAHAEFDELALRGARRIQGAPPDFQPQLVQMLKEEVTRHLDEEQERINRLRELNDDNNEKRTPVKSPGSPREKPREPDA